MCWFSLQSPVGNVLLALVAGPSVGRTDGLLGWRCAEDKCFPNTVKPQAPIAATIKGLWQAACSDSILHNEKGKNTSPRGLATCMDQVRQIQDKDQLRGRRRWEWGDPLMKKALAWGLTCKRGVLLGGDYGCSQKSWGHFKENWMSLELFLPESSNEHRKKDWTAATTEQSGLT